MANILPTNPHLPTFLTISIWCAKSALTKVAGGGHITLGSLVATTTKKGVEKSALPIGSQGKVVQTGTANPFSAKKAVGTTQAHQVEFVLPLSLFGDGVYDLTHASGGTGPLWGVLKGGQWFGTYPNKAIATQKAAS